MLIDPTVLAKSYMEHMEKLEKLRKADKAESKSEVSNDVVQAVLELMQGCEVTMETEDSALSWTRTHRISVRIGGVLVKEVVITTKEVPPF
jgi:hypothetical protein